MTRAPQRKRTRSAPPAKKATKTTTKQAPAKPTKAAVPKEKKPAAPRERDPRLPAVGTEMVRPYKGKDIRVKVLDDGFEYEGTHYRSLTKVAMAVTGYKAISGPAFFRITEPKRAEETATE